MMPVLFLRQWEVGPAEVGQIVGLIFFLTGLPGMIFGGVLATKLSKVDRRWEAWVSPRLFPRNPCISMASALPR